jgi:hypothetical protein
METRLLPFYRLHESVIHFQQQYWKASSMHLSLCFLCSEEALASYQELYNPKLPVMNKKEKKE